MSLANPVAPISRLILPLMALLCLAGCAGVKVNAVKNHDYLASRRGDVLTTGQLSVSSKTTLQVLGIDEKTCRHDLPACRDRFKTQDGVTDENRLSSLSELWLLQAMKGGLPQRSPDLVNAYLESARYAYAYLFFSNRPTGQRAFEERQTQVRDYYNFAVQESLTHLFALLHNTPQGAAMTDGHFSGVMGQWRIRGSMQGMTLGNGGGLPSELIPASSLNFAGVRNQYQRDGLGAALVAVTDKRVVRHGSEQQPWSEMTFPDVSAVIRFPGNSLDQVLATHTADITGYDPYRTAQFEAAGQKVPLAANFTAGYGLWLSRSGFARQSLATLVGRGEVLDGPHLYMLQPYDPNRHILIMLHGLASSPEAWINVANEVLGDDSLRNNYQIWQIYYPTNLPLALNNKEIHDTIEQTLHHFDPQGTATASHDVVLLGHSMGGMLARLLVSSSNGDQLWNTLPEQYGIKRQRLEKVRAKVEPYLKFEPLPQVSRAIFAAAPHRGTPFAENRLSRWASSLIRLPVSVLGRFTEIAKTVIDPNSASPVALTRGFNSIANLSDQDPFVKATAALPISPKVRYHSIIGDYTPKLPLAESSDGVVPYSSSHLAGAVSEKVIPSWHSVQEKPEAIIEIRRILHEHLNELSSR